MKQTILLLINLLFSITILAQTFTQQTRTNSPFDGVDVGTHSSLAFADINGNDGLDLFLGQGQAIIYNVLGQPVQSFNIEVPTFRVNTTDLPKGQYILHIQQENGQFTAQQFIK